MFNNNNLVTIGILCYNAETSILKALKSAKLQTYKNVEIIVVDDFSSDRSVNIIKKSDFYKNVKLIENKKNMGTGYSRNIVLKNAKGSFICFMDDDDFSDKKRIESQIKAILKAGLNETNYVLSICNINREYSSGYIKSMKVFGTYDKKPSSNEMIDFLLFNSKKKNTDYGFGCPTCAMLVSKIALEKVGGFDENLRRVEDMDITLRLCHLSCHLISTKDTFVNQYATNGEDKSPLKNLESEIRVIRKNKKYLEKKNMYFYSRIWPYLRFYHFTKNYLFLILFLLVLIFIKPFKTINHFTNSAFRRIRLEHRINSFKKL